MIGSNPTNKNFLAPTGYKFVLARAPNLEYNVQTCLIPGIELGGSAINTPFTSIPVTGKVSWNPLVITYKVAEDLSDYLEIWNWIIKLGFPEQFDQYKSLSDNNDTANLDQLDSDITVTMLNSAMKPAVNFKFYDCFPISQTELQMTTTDADINYVETTAAFRYLRYEIEVV